MKLDLFLGDNFSNCPLETEVKKSLSQCTVKGDIQEREHPTSTCSLFCMVSLQHRFQAFPANWVAISLVVNIPPVFKYPKFQHYETYSFTKIGMKPWAASAPVNIDYTEETREMKVTKFTAESQQASHNNPLNTHCVP